MSEYEKNVYTNLFEYPTKHIVKLELENEKKDKEIEQLNNIIKNLDKMFEYYFIGNKKYDENTVNTIYIKYIKLKELKESDNNE